MRFVDIDFCDIQKPTLFTAVGRFLWEVEVIVAGLQIYS